MLLMYESVSIKTNTEDSHVIFELKDVHCIWIFMLLFYMWSSVEMNVFYG